MITAEITVREADKVVGKMRPARWFFLKSPQPTTEVALQRSPAEDLYLTLANYDFAENAALLKAVINPLIDWIWLGFVMLALGTGIALLPESVLAPIAVRAGAGEAGAVARATVLLVAVGFGAATALAPAPALARTPAELAADRKWLGDNLMCLCGCRARLSDCAMPKCGHKDPMFDEIDQMLAAGQTREQIQQRFVAEHGNLVLLAPPDKGFNRLAWAVPYVFGAAGAAGLGLVAWRFARKPAGIPAQATPTGSTASAAVATKDAADPDLEDRLEDELAKIDT
jgi:cytochrome c-type biogenesis protein CcmF